MRKPVSLLSLVLPLFWTFSITAIFTSFVHAAQIGELEGMDVPTLEIRGEIKRGDLQAFARAALRAKGLRNVVLSSPGGDVIEAIRIGELVRSLRLLTIVSPKEPCASACFFIWLKESLQKLFATALELNTLKARYLPLGLVPRYLSADDFTKVIDDEVKWLATTVKGADLNLI